MWVWIAAIVVVSGLTWVVPETTAGRPVTTADNPSGLEETVKQYLLKLSAEPGMESWKQAEWTTYPLGPGTHGWVVILSKNGSEIGYMVLYATPDGAYELGEYGTGLSPLFSPHTLYRGLIRHELIPESADFAQFMKQTDLKDSRIYHDALFAFWKVNLAGRTYIFDAKTGEQLPVTEEQVDSLRPFRGQTVTVPLPDKVLDNFQRTPADPYENLSWLAQQPFEPDHFPSLKQTLQHAKRLLFVAEMFSGQVLKPFAIAGYQEWETAGPYLIVDEEGLRYIPYSTAVRHGHFYD